jgi:hypothetical protein
MREIRFSETPLTADLIDIFELWHTSRFPKCRGGIKHNNHCNHFEWFLVGWAAARGNYFLMA